MWSDDGGDRAELLRAAKAKESLVVRMKVRMSSRMVVGCKSPMTTVRTLGIKTSL